MMTRPPTEAAYYGEVMKWHDSQPILVNGPPSLQ
jgi:hypothetical protein